MSAGAVAVGVLGCLGGMGLAAGLADAAVEVRGDSVCPRPLEVANQLAQLVVASRDDAPPDIAWLSDDGGASVRLQLRRNGDEAIEDKALPAGLSCAERASTAAVILAAWEARLDPPDGAPVIARLPRLDPLEPASGTDPTPAGAVVIDGSTGAFMAVTSAGTAVALVADLSLTPPSSRLGVTTGLLAVDAHSVALFSGPVSWRRLGLTTQAHWRLASRSLWVEAQGGLVFSLIHVVSDAPSATVFDPGVTAGLRIGTATAPAFWLQVSAAYWPRVHEVYTHSGVVVNELAPDQRKLPGLELLAGLGVAFGRER
jgi:hypothetical protein